MSNVLISLLVSSFFCLLFVSCDEPGKEDVLEREKEEVKTVSTITTSNYLINNHSVLGVSPGSDIELHKDKIVKGEILNSSRTIYEIQTEDNKSLAFFYPSELDVTKVGEIVVVSPLAKTAKGIAPDDNYGKLLRAYPDLKLKGKNQYNRVYAIVSNLSFRLDYESGKQSVDVNDVPKDTRILDVIIND